MVNGSRWVSGSGIAFSQNQKNYCACEQAGFILLAVQSSNDRLPIASRERNR
jgi:hypothetical protein